MKRRSSILACEINPRNKYAKILIDSYGFIYRKILWGSSALHTIQDEGFTFNSILEKRSD